MIINCVFVRLYAVDNWGYHRQGSCQAGMSGAVSRNGKKVFVGAPGSFYWQGQVFSHDLDQQTTLSSNKGHIVDDDSFLGRVFIEIKI